MKSTITFLVNASFSRQCPKTWRRRAMIFVFTDCWEVIFWRKKRGKTHIFHIYRPLPYSSRDGENMLTSFPPSVEITPKTPAKFASLNSSIAFGDLRLGGCLRGPPPQAPARAQSPARNTRIKRRKIRRDFVGYFVDYFNFQNQGFLPQNFWFELTSHIYHMWPHIILHPVHIPGTYI